MSELFPEDDDRCTDPLDQAGKVETRMRENDLARARARSAPEQVQVAVLDEQGKPLVDTHGKPQMYWPVTECVDCDDEIPPARLKLARIRCVTCQEKLEKQRRQNGC